MNYPYSTPSVLRTWTIGTLLGLLLGIAAVATVGVVA